MALAFSLVDQSFTATGTTTQVTASVTTAASQLYVIDVIADRAAGSNAAPTSVAGAGLTFAQLDGAFLDSGSTVHVSRWRAEATGVNSGTITITWANAQTEAGFVLHRVTGHNTGSNGANAFNANKSVVGVAGSGATQSLTLSALASVNNATLAAFAYGFGSTPALTGTAGNSFIELGDVSVTGAGYALGIETQYLTNAVNPTVTWSGTAADRAALAHEILAAAAPPATTPGTLGMWDPSLRILSWF